MLLTLGLHSLWPYAPCTEIKPASRDWSYYNCDALHNTSFETVCTYYIRTLQWKKGFGVLREIMNMMFLIVIWVKSEILSLRWGNYVAIEYPAFARTRLIANPKLREFIQKFLEWQGQKRKNLSVLLIKNQNVGENPQRHFLNTTTNL